MWIREARYRQFRNTDDVALAFSPSQNVFLGENGAGKTNLLEGLLYLSNGRSHRTRHDRELMQHHAEFATLRVVAESHLHGGDVTVEAALTRTATGTFKTLFKLNGHPVRSRSDIVGKLPTVSFFVSDLLMLRGTPEDRRNGLDRALVQYDPLHFKRLTAYSRIRQQKSQFLKQTGGFLGAAQQPLLDSLNDQLIEAGCAVMQGRIAYLDALEPPAKTAYADLCDQAEALALRYQVSYREDVLEDAPDAAPIGMAQAFGEAIRRHQTDEVRRGQVLVGPHRDDIRFFLDGQDAGMFGSQGQQRSIILAMKLAEIRLLAARQQGEHPVLLLDDVMAELDLSRQSRLLSAVDPAMQVFLTTTHLDAGLQWFLAENQSARIFQVIAGVVHESPVTAPQADLAPRA